MFVGLQLIRTGYEKEKSQPQCSEVTKETIYVIQTGRCRRLFQGARSTVYKAAPGNATFKLIKFILMELEVTGSTPAYGFYLPGITELLFIPLPLAGKMKHYLKAF